MTNPEHQKDATTELTEAMLQAVIAAQVADLSAANVARSLKVFAGVVEAVEAKGEWGAHRNEPNPAAIEKAIITRPIANPQ